LAVALGRFAGDNRAVSTHLVNTPVGEQFARALAARDASRLRELLAPDIDFRALTPNKFWESNSASEVIDDVMLGRWIEPTDHIDEVESIEHDTVVDRERVGYRVRGTNADGPFVLEQQAYYTVVDGRIVWLRIMCSGFRPATA
jgi:ketosteroid isomerase-like protein